MAGILGIGKKGLMPYRREVGLPQCPPCSLLTRLPLFFLIGPLFLTESFQVPHKQYIHAIMSFIFIGLFVIILKHYRLVL